MNLDETVLNVTKTFQATLSNEFILKQHIKVQVLSWYNLTTRNSLPVVNILLWIYLKIIINNIFFKFRNVNSKIIDKKKEYVSVIKQRNNTSLVSVTQNLVFYVRSWRIVAQIRQHSWIESQQ